MRYTFFGCPRVLAGVILMGTGTFVLCENFVAAVARLSQVLGANGSSAIGVLPAVALAISFDQQPILQWVLQQLAMISWPLVFVTFGTLLSRDVSQDRARVCKERTAL